MSVGARKMFAQMLRAARKGQCMFGGVEDIKAWARRCAMKGPVGKLPA